MSSPESKRAVCGGLAARDAVDVPQRSAMAPHPRPLTRARRRRVFGALLAALVATVAPPRIAAAQPAPPSADPGRRAVALGREALALFEAGRFAEAHERFAEADEIVHSPVFVLYMARTKRAQGELLAASERYQRVRDEPLPADAPEPWRHAQAEAAVELAELAARLPTVVVVGPVAAVFVNGAPASLGQPLRLDPGSHQISMRDASGRQHDETVVLREGEERRLVFPSADPEGPIWPGTLLLAVGLGGLTVGTITGTIAKIEADDIKSRCVGDACLEVDAPRADQARALATASTVSFVAGGALAAAGVVLLVVRPGGDDGVGVGLWPGGLTLRGRF